MPDARAVEEQVNRSIKYLRQLTVVVLGTLTLITVATLIVVLMAVIPGWPINRQGQENTGRAVSTINEVSVLAAFCAHQHDQLPAIRTCVANGMKELKEPR